MSLEETENKAKFWELISNLCSRSPMDDFPIQDVTNYFGADGSTYWIKKPFDYKDLTLVSFFNRKDLEQNEDEFAFSEKNSTLAKYTIEKEKRYAILGKNEFINCNWQNPYLRDTFKRDFSEVLLIVFYTEPNEIIGSLHLYYRQGINSLANTEELKVFSYVMSGMIMVFKSRLESILSERRKIGHEIARLIADCDNKLERLNNLLKRTGVFKTTKAAAHINDMKTSFESAREALENEKFSEGVAKRVPVSRFISLKNQYKTSSHSVFSALQDNHSIYPLSSTSERLEVQIHRTDLDLLFRNLLSNAGKYSLPDSPIVCTVKQSSSSCIFSILNQSNAIPEEEWDLVWNFGFRGSNKKKIKGDGVGLSIVSDICRGYDMGKMFRQLKRQGALWTEISITIPRKRFRYNRQS